MSSPLPIDNGTAEPTAPLAPEHREWWCDATIYQIYLPSFADGSGDGIGDLTGIQYRLEYLRDLGVDAISVGPWYPSPMANGGYDIVDHRDIDPMFGDLADAEDLIADAHHNGLRVIIDLVPNHCSVEHPWFQAALAAGPDSAQRDRFHFRPGRGTHGAQPPDDRQAVLGGPAWSRVTEPDGSRGQWYLHRFHRSQPEFNWSHPDVRREFEEILRFWLDRGVDGFRVDAADRLGTGRPDAHDIFRSWRGIVDSYSTRRILIGDIRRCGPAQVTRCPRPGGLHCATTTEFAHSPWRADPLRRIIDETMRRHRQLDAPPVWTLSDHNTTRQVTRYGRPDSGVAVDQSRTCPLPVDLTVGTRRARAAALLALALPGAVMIYQGDELGLWDVETLPDTTSTDPVWHRAGRGDRGCDGFRVPMPWFDEEASFGFSPAGALSRPWLPQPREWRAVSAAAQLDDPRSMVTLYRQALRIRHREPALGRHDLTWLPAPAGVLAFTRCGGFVCVVNVSSSPLPLPPRHRTLLASGEISGLVPSDTAVWLRAVDAGNVTTEWPLAG